MKLFMILLTFTIFLFVNCTQSSETGRPSNQEHKKLKYVCPMHPQITTNEPGKCSICGMDLVPDKGDSASDMPLNSKKIKPEGRASIKLTLENQQLIGVTTEVVKKINLFKTVVAPGRIAFDPELYTAQSEYLEAVRQWNLVKDSPLKEVRKSTSEMIKSSKMRLQVMGLSSADIDSIALKGRVSDNLIVGNNQGENLIYADVYEADLSNIKKGQSVKVEGSFLGGDTLKGEVVSVDQVIDPKTRTAKVRIKIEKTKASIRPEAFVNVTIYVPLGERLAISLESVLDTGRDLFVFVKKDNGVFEPRKITKLFETDEHMAVLTGLDENETIVTSANFMLDSESRLRAVIKKASQNSHEHNH